MVELPEYLRWLEQIETMKRSKDPMEMMYGYFCEQQYHKHDIALWVIHPELMQHIVRSLRDNQLNQHWEIQNQKQIFGIAFVINKDAPENKPLIISRHEFNQSGVELKYAN